MARRMDHLRQDTKYIFFDQSIDFDYYFKSIDRFSFSSRYPPPWKALSSTETLWIRSWTFHRYCSHRRRKALTKRGKRRREARHCSESARKGIPRTIWAISRVFWRANCPGHVLEWLTKLAEKFLGTLFLKKLQVVSDLSIPSPASNGNGSNGTEHATDAEQAIHQQQQQQLQAVQAARLWTAALSLVAARQGQMGGGCRLPLPPFAAAAVSRGMPAAVI